MSSSHDAFLKVIPSWRGFFAVTASSGQTFIVLPYLSPSERDFSNMSDRPKSARLSIDGVDKRPDEIIWWIEENIINEYEKPEEIAKAYEMLAKSDLFFVRIRKRQNWKLMKYGIDLMTAGVAVSKNEMYRKFSKYQYPNKIKYLGMTKIKRAKEKADLTEASHKLHCSINKVKKEYLPFFKAEELKM